MTSTSGARAEWLAHLLSTAPADRTRAEAAVSTLYIAAGFAAPRHFLWFDSPCAATWAVALLIAPYHFLWTNKLQSSALTRAEKERAEHTRKLLIDRFGVRDWADVAAAAGQPRGSSMRFPPDPSRLLAAKMQSERFSLVDNASALFVVHGDDDDLQRAEKYYYGGNHGALKSELHCPMTSSLLGASFFEDYSFSKMADDSSRAANRPTPPTLSAAWDVARSAGMWWPFENVAILSERAAELSLNDKKVLHSEDGPAAVFRDGWRVFAWNGKAVPERWIMAPESVPSREYKGFDPTFRKHVESLAKSQKKVAGGKRAKAEAARFLERYQAGEHKKVWTELVALGADVRRDPYAADALAVAHETMRRVESNIRTVIERLQAMNYSFADEAGARKPPQTRAAIAAFEKEFGILPLSLRAFHEIVGEVNLIGSHPGVNPRGGSVAADPLVVYGLHDQLVELDDEDEDASIIVIAPDDLHKADTSGGDSYAMAIPDPRADGELVNERHGLLFVDYLRMCFQFGGFPGYDGLAVRPSELASLSEGLVQF
jgi:hypothetical protein